MVVLILHAKSQQSAGWFNDVKRGCCDAANSPTYDDKLSDGMERHRDRKPYLEPGTRSVLQCNLVVLENVDIK